MSQDSRPRQANLEWDDDDETLWEKDDDDEPLLGSATHSGRVPRTEPNILLDRILDQDRARRQLRGDGDEYSLDYNMPSMLALHIVLATTKTLGPLSLAYEEIRNQQRKAIEAANSTKRSEISHHSTRQRTRQSHKECKRERIKMVAKKVSGAFMSCKCESDNL